VTEDNKDFKGRRAVLAGFGIAAAGATLAATTANAQSSRRSRAAFQPARHDLDAWMNELPGSHRIFVDTASAGGGTDSLRYASNIYNAHMNAYSGKAADLAMIVCFRHFSTPLGFNSALWEKYGDGFRQVMNIAAGTGQPNVGAAIDSLAAQGAQFAICNTATQFIASRLAQTTAASTDDVYKELIAGAIGSSRFVPAGVMALTRAQEYGYSVLIAG
jgi:intracellular sulfur oxidation DsrE/DsrF family protein